MTFHVITLFPGVVEAYVGCGVLGKAVQSGAIRVRCVQLRDFARDKHRTVDDYPHGGGAGMVLKPEPLFTAVEHVRGTLETAAAKAPVILMTPRGERFTAATAMELAGLDEMIIVCGHYGGVDERVHEHLADREISVGDFVVTGGELPALILIDAVSRFAPGVVGSPESVEGDSYQDSLLGSPAYTRPADFRGMVVPAALLGGNHREIEKWRRREKLRRTFERRPELLAGAALSGEDIEFLKSLGYSPRVDRGGAR
ncbi:MAG: tRNA (guanosine(37)-N1)-methyltransferase TrmD [bacterium]